MTFYVTEVCRDCGNLKSVCSSEELSDKWYPQRTVCYATAAKEAAWRAVNAHHKPKPDDHGPHTTDGWGIWTAQFDLTPDDDFEGALRLLGAPSPGSQSDHEHQYADDAEHHAGLSDIFSTERGKQHGNQ